jgi:NAD+ kinase
MQTIGIYYSNKDHAHAIAREISAWIKAQNKKVYDITACPNATIPDIDLVISVGGDGSLLRVAFLLGDRDIPVLGVNAGNLGFLTSTRQEEFIKELESVFQGQYSIEKRLMVRTYLGGGATKDLVHDDVLNDIVINREGLTRFLTLTIDVDDSTLMRFGGDGLIVSTPTGSSAYSLSAGGPLLFPTLEGILITPICPHSLRIRPVIVPAGQTIKITLECENSDDRAAIVFDGQRRNIIHSGSVVTVKKSPRSFQLVYCSQRNFYDIVREKL